MAGGGRKVGGKAVYKILFLGDKKCSQNDCDHISVIHISVNVLKITVFHFKWVTCMIYGLKNWVTKTGDRNGNFKERFSDMYPKIQANKQKVNYF